MKRPLWAVSKPSLRKVIGQLLQQELETPLRTTDSVIPPVDASEETATTQTVLAFEDMQWADASLLDFVEYLLEWSRSSPIFVMTLARPELHERRPTWGAGERSFTSLYLEPLSPERMRDLIHLEPSQIEIVPSQDPECAEHYIGIVRLAFRPPERESRPGGNRFFHVPGAVRPND